MPAISNFRHLIFPVFYSAQHIRAAFCIQPAASVRADVLFLDFLYTQNFRIFHKVSGAFFRFNALFYTYSLCKLNAALLPLMLHHLVSFSKIKYCSQAAANMDTI